MALDLSCNVMHGPGVVALASFFSNRTVLEDVDLSSCGITCADVTVLFSVLKVYSNRLEECRLASNLIGEQGVHSICSYLISEHCHLVELDLSWNNAREAGAGYFANVAIPYNKTLKVLNLSSNAIGDTGGQFLMSSLKFNSKLTHLTLSQNEIADYTCFVASKVVRVRPYL
jgi:Ran GTPase-activating protein (RanGAP) involved in mRNA processing and transport